MKYYCNRCHRLYEDKRACPMCKGEVLTKKIDGTNPVTIVSAFGIEKDRITAALEDGDIPYATRAEKKEASARAVTGVDNARYRIEVPYSYYNKAMDILVGINAVEPEEYIQDDEPVDNTAEEFEQMSSAKRTTIRIVSAVLFILVVALVIFGVDAITGTIKGLFT